MSWLLLVFAALLIWLGVDMLRLSTIRSSLPQSESDKIFFGDPPPPLSQAARNYLESRFMARGGASTLILGTVFLVAGVVMAIAGLGWLP